MLEGLWEPVQRDLGSASLISHCRVGAALTACWAGLGAGENLFSVIVLSPISLLKTFVEGLSVDNSSFLYGGTKALKYFKEWLFPAQPQGVRVTWKSLLWQP